MEFILKSALLIGIIYSFYKIFLQKETFFKSIRVYFIIGLLVTVVLPLLIIPIYIETTQTTSYVPEIIETVNLETEIFTEATVTNIKKTFNWVSFFTSFYFIGFAFFSIKFIIEIVSLYQLIYQSNKFRNGKITFAETIKSISPFSIFNYIVYNKNQFTKTELAQIIAHEKVHIKQLHTYDMFLVHILVIVQWFNPFAWLYKKELQQNLEFLADKHAQENIETLKEYQYLLLKTSIKKNPFALSTNFYNSLIKKRIIMLQKTPSKKLNKLKYVLLLPLLALFLYAFNTKEIVKPINETFFSNLPTIGKKKLIVFDVSHGGKDPGAKVDNILEKDIVLKISQKIKSLYKGEHNLVFTREKDEFISLSERVNRINILNPDLVISLHVNNTTKNINVNGLVAYASEDNIAFKKSKEIANKLLNAIANEDIKIKGFSKGNLTIIKKVNSPAVLLELGFISNKNDRKYINSKKGQIKIAKSIINFLNGNVISSKKVKFINPIHLKNVIKISSGFEIRRSPFSKEKKFHNGIDIIAHKGTDVYATADGIVIKATYDKLKGNYIQIKHANNYQTNYHHLGEIQIALGEQVKAGEIISTVGNSGRSTGPHLHYEVVKDDKNINPKPFVKYFITKTFKIDKNSTRKELKDIENAFGSKKSPAQLRFTNIKYNSNKEIISLNIETKFKGEKQYNKRLIQESSKPIDNIKISFIDNSADIIIKTSKTIATINKNHIDIEDNTRNIGLDGFNIIIQSKTSDKELEIFQQKFQMENNVTLKIFDVKRNSNNEIIAIKIEGKSKDSSSSYSFSQDQPISEILLGYDKGNDEIIIENIEFTTNSNKRNSFKYTRDSKSNDNNNDLFFKGKRVKGMMIKSKFTTNEIEKLVNDFKNKFNVNIEVYDIKRNIDNEIIALKIKANSKNASKSFSFNDKNSFYSITAIYLADKDEFMISKWDDKTKKYTVKARDTYYSIAKKYNMSVAKLQKLNQSKEFKVGTKLIIKKDSRYNNKKISTSTTPTVLVNLLDDDNEKVVDRIIFEGDDIDETTFIVNGKKMTKEELEKIDRKTIRHINIVDNDIIIRTSQQSGLRKGELFKPKTKKRALNVLKILNRHDAKFYYNESEISFNKALKIVRNNFLNVTVVGDTENEVVKISDKLNNNPGSLNYNNESFYYSIKNNKTTFYNKFGDEVNNKTSKELLKLLKDKLE